MPQLPQLVCCCQVEALASSCVQLDSNSSNETTSGRRLTLVPALHMKRAAQIADNSASRQREASRKIEKCGPSKPEALQALQDRLQVLTIPRVPNIKAIW